ncbi:MAG: TetR/AcrR family transcriptional regulator [Deltaproteobacteria bacterium]|nr:TetR/AcrR family transcriptional regulator [Deltaproteobacteria bacterium]
MATTSRAEHTRARVLDAALRTFAEGGLAGLTIQAIRDRCGVSVGSLYHHFGNRDGIALALYERSLLALLDRIQADALRTRSAKGLIRAMIVAYLDWVEANVDAARFLFAAPAELDPLASPALVQRKRARVLPLAQRALEHAAAGEVASLPPAYYELVVIGQVAETARRWLGGEPIDLGEARTILARTAWRALQP